MSLSLQNLQVFERYGHIEECRGLKLVSHGPPQTFVGELCDIIAKDNQVLMQAEVIGFKGKEVFLMPLARGAIQMGLKVRATGESITIPVGEELLGRIIDAEGKPLDSDKALKTKQRKTILNDKLNPLDREPIHQRLHTGIYAIDALKPLGQGQRLGLFAGSGVGKSVLLGLMAKHLQSDVNVIALIGERGREVNDFILQNLDAKTREKSIIVVASSDDFALMRRQAAYTATTIAEYFSEQGQKVMLFMDSITRFAMAQREIGLSLNEPPTARGYTPSVFARLPPLVERAGNFKDRGSITALYTVLVEGDDFNEPIADTLRSLLDGHIVLNRDLALRCHYPAIDLLQSSSRLQQQICNATEHQIIQRVMRELSLYQQNKTLIDLGAYEKGRQEKLDRAIERVFAIETLFNQGVESLLKSSQVYQRLEEIFQ